MAIDVLIEAKAWRPDLHPRDRLGRFRDVYKAVLGLKVGQAMDLSKIVDDAPHIQSAYAWRTKDGWELRGYSTSGVYGHRITPQQLAENEHEIEDRLEAINVADPFPDLKKCGCGCGAPIGTKARYVPGHDARHKSNLVKATLLGDQAARNELYALGWGKFHEKTADKAYPTVQPTPDPNEDFGPVGISPPEEAFDEPKDTPETTWEDDIAQAEATPAPKKAHWGDPDWEPPPPVDHLANEEAWTKDEDGYPVLWKPYIDKHHLDPEEVDALQKEKLEQEQDAADDAIIDAEVDEQLAEDEWEPTGSQLADTVVHEASQVDDEFSDVEPYPDLPTCNCGCGGTRSPTAKYLPGHDARHKSQLVKAAKEGDQRAYATLKAKGWLKFLDKSKDSGPKEPKTAKAQKAAAEPKTWSYDPERVPAGLPLSADVYPNFEILDPGPGDREEQIARLTERRNKARSLVDREMLNEALFRLRGGHEDGNVITRPSDDTRALRRWAASLWLREQGWIMPPNNKNWFTDAGAIKYDNLPEELRDGLREMMATKGARQPYIDRAMKEMDEFARVDEPADEAMRRHVLMQMEEALQKQGHGSLDVEHHEDRGILRYAQSLRLMDWLQKRVDSFGEDLQPSQIAAGNPAYWIEQVVRPYTPKYGADEGVDYVARVELAKKLWAHDPEFISLVEQKSTPYALETRLKMHFRANTNGFAERWWNEHGRDAVQKHNFAATLSNTDLDYFNKRVFERAQQYKVKKESGDESVLLSEASMHDVTFDDFAVDEAFDDSIYESDTPDRGRAIFLRDSPFDDDYVMAYGTQHDPSKINDLNQVDPFVYAHGASLTDLVIGDFWRDTDEPNDVYQVMERGYEGETYYWYMRRLETNQIIRIPEVQVLDWGLVEKLRNEFIYGVKLEDVQQGDMITAYGGWIQGDNIPMGAKMMMPDGRYVIESVQPNMDGASVTFLRKGPQGVDDRVTVQLNKDVRLDRVLRVIRSDAAAIGAYEVRAKVRPDAITDVAQKMIDLGAEPKQSTWRSSPGIGNQGSWANDAIGKAENQAESLQLDLGDGKSIEFVPENPGKLTKTSKGDPEPAKKFLTDLKSGVKYLRVDVDSDSPNDYGNSIPLILDLETMEVKAALWTEGDYSNRQKVRAMASKAGGPVWLPPNHVEPYALGNKSGNGFFRRPRTSSGQRIKFSMYTNDNPAGMDRYALEERVNAILAEHGLKANKTGYFEFLEAHKGPIAYGDLSSQLRQGGEPVTADTSAIASAKFNLNIRHEMRKMRIKGMTPSEAARWIEENLGAQVEKRVPLRHIYRSDRKMGPITPLHNDYADGSVKPVYGDYGLVHSVGKGLAGLQAVLRTGGLASIAEKIERRKAGRDMGEGYSERGDIGSGLADHVFLTFSASGTAYGNTSSFRFIFRPETGMRTRALFTYKDFGGGHDRNSQYRSYMKKWGAEFDEGGSPSQIANRDRLEESIYQSNAEINLYGEAPIEDVAILIVPEQYRHDENARKALEDFQRMNPDAEIRWTQPYHEDAVMHAAFKELNEKTGFGFRKDHKDSKKLRYTWAPGTTVQFAVAGTDLEGATMKNLLAGSITKIFIDQVNNEPMAIVKLAQTTVVGGIGSATVPVRNIRWANQTSIPLSDDLPVENSGLFVSE